MTEFLQRFPEPEVLAAIRSAAVHSQERLRRRAAGRRKRDDSNKAQVFFRHMARRLTEVPDDLSSVLNLKTKDASQLVLPDIVVDEPKSEPAASLVKDMFDTLFATPSFEEFRIVFDRYPYVWEMDHPEYGRVLVLGYASGRNTDGELIRRNCVVNRFKSEGGDPTEREDHSFNDLQSVVGYLKSNDGKDGSIHRFIKVLRYQVGMGIRFWTNTEKGDLPEFYRFIVLTEEGPKYYPSRAAYDEALSQYKPSIPAESVTSPV
jgi:hypothetical protein